MPRFLSALFLLTLGLSAADVFEQQRQLGRGLNMGNMLEAPTEGAWGLRVADEDFPRIKAAGFDSVRIPTKWSAHAAKEAPYMIDAEFMDRVEHIVKTALAAKLTVLLNLHHYDEMDKEPAQHRERFTAFWKQISTRFAAYPDRLQFELFNEPNGNHSAAEWNQSLLAGLREVRRVNPERAVHISTGTTQAIRAAACHGFRGRSRVNCHYSVARHCGAASVYRIGSYHGITSVTRVSTEIKYKASSC